MHRFKDIGWAYTAAVFAASAAIALSVAAMVVISPGGSAQALTGRIGGGLVLAAFASIYVFPFTFLFALLPAGAAILYAERREVRSPGAYALLGMLVGVASFAWAVLLFDWITYSSSRPARITPMLQAFAPIALGALYFVIPGLCAGLAYWAKAGRYAGD
jgi:hypothetical protein